MSSEQFNFIEGFWWIGLGITVGLFAKKRLEKKAILIFSTAILIFFGISDLIEIQTGAWWQPWWLLAWKAGCIAAGMICLMVYFKNRRQL